MVRSDHRLDNMSREETFRIIEVEKAIAVIRLREKEKLLAVVEALVAGGIRCVEITMTVPGAIEAIAELDGCVENNVVLGAGTVLDAATASRAIEAGARFIVSPVFMREVVQKCIEQNTVVIPGCFTPTEIHAAWKSGADAVKVFPAGLLGASFLRNIHGPLPGVKLVPTGGVTVENAAAWIEAGATAVAVGTDLVDRNAVERADYRIITERAFRLVSSLKDQASGK